jgi:hypothetical protein
MARTPKVDRRKFLASVAVAGLLGASRILKNKLRDHTYRPGPSICFVIDGPKPREVFAAVGAFDRHAAANTTSVYTTAKVFPMLPTLQAHCMNRRSGPTMMETSGSSAD